MTVRALVTGASSGIGAATAVALAGAGARVVLTGRDRDRLEAVAARCGVGAAATVPGELPADAVRIVEEARSALGGIDLVVNSAGVPRRVHARRLALADVERTVATNYVGAVAVTLAALPEMLGRGSGDVVNVGSVAGRVPAPREAAYSASKAALAAFTEVLAIDLRGTGVRVHLVTPGVVDTPLWDLPDQEPAAVAGGVRPERVASAIVALVGSDRFERYVPRRFRAVTVARPVLGRGYLRAAAAFDRWRVPGAHRS